MGNLKKGPMFLALGALIIGVVLSSGFFGCKMEKETIGATNGELGPREGIPTIDGSAPVRTETATFALG